MFRNVIAPLFQRHLSSEILVNKGGVIMSEKGLNLSRRKFMAVSSAAIAAPILNNITGMVPDAKGAEKSYDFIDKKSCDLVVLGGGGSGMVAAVRAAQLTGKKVIVLEKAQAVGGGAMFARTIRTFGSKWQADRNLQDTTIEYARDMMDLVYWRLDTKLVLNCLRGTGQFFDWLCEQGGDIEDMFDIGQYAHVLIGSEPFGPQMDPEKSGKRFGRFVMDIMKEKCERYGVEVLTKHPVVDVEVKNGKIVAAIAKSEAGYVRVACKACILSTGSWINNEEILKKCYPQFVGMKKYMDPSEHMNPNYTGDGIPLAEKVGAFVDYDSFCMRLMGPIYDLARDTGTSKVFLAMSQSPYIITVNLDGKRYSAEPVGHIGHFTDGHVQIEQTNGQSFDIFDENTLAATFKLPKCGQTGEDAGTLGCYSLTWMSPRELIHLPDTMEEVYSSINEGFAKGDRYMFKGDTLEELADQIGVNKKNFLKTVRKYNESCEKGVDNDFFKRKDALVPINRPPYYAFFGKLMTDGAFGGVLVNPEMQAYKPDGGLVEGLYVIGDFASGRFINMGGVKHQVLNDISWAFSSGFLAGTNAGKYLGSL
jgi:fumarate reductase flavoprotein subunit